MGIGTIGNRLAGGLLCLLLGGCLYTARPVFDAERSVALDAAPGFAEFVRVAEAFGGAPFQRGEIEPATVRAVDLGRFLVLEIHEPGETAALHLAIGHAGGRPFLCEVETGPGLERAAEAAGLAVAYRLTGLGLRLPAEPRPERAAYPVFDGPDEALFAFVLDRFARGPLACEFPVPED